MLQRVVNSYYLVLFFLSAFVLSKCCTLLVKSIKDSVALIDVLVMLNVLRLLLLQPARELSCFYLITVVYSIYVVVVCCVEQAIIVRVYSVKVRFILLIAYSLL
jgi:hypothetical protein